MSHSYTEYKRSPNRESYTRESPTRQASTTAGDAQSPQAQPPAPHDFPHTSPYVGECMCPTCQYYTALSVYQREVTPSPNTDYNAYAAMFSPMQNAAIAAYVNAYLMLSQHGITEPTNANNASPTSPTIDDSESINASAQAISEQFAMCLGSIAQTACTPRGRSFLQAVIRLQHLDKISIMFKEFLEASETISLDPHGCHVARHLVEVIDDVQAKSFVSTLTETQVLNMATVSQYTRRILQTLFERHSRCDLTIVVDALAANARYLSATQQGCIALMRVFEQCPYEYRVKLLSTLLPVFAELACDPFGNYVVQCILDHSERPLAIKYVSDYFPGRFLKLSCNKYASNVMEKVIRAAPQTLRKLIMDELIFNPANLQQIAQDGYGNFVLQALIDTCATPVEFKKLSERVRSVLPHSPYGHKIESKLRAKRFSGQNPRNTYTREDKENVAPLAVNQ